MIHILIADHDPATRKAFSLLLRRKLDTIEIVEVGDLETLIRTVVDSPPDLLLLDWRLYGSPAPQTCRLFRKAYPQLKIALLSVDPEDASAAKEAGAAFIHKGASPDELMTTLKPLLSEKQDCSQPSSEKTDESETESIS